MRKILVALDESDASRRVVEFVHRFFDGLDVEVLAVNVSPVETPWATPFATWGGIYPMGYAYGSLGLAPDALPSAEEVADEARRHAVGVVESSGLAPDETIAEVGDPAEAILAAAAEHDVDLVVVGSNEKNLFQRLLSPSVSRELLQHAERPVLVVR